MNSMKDMLGDTPYMEMFAPFQPHSETSREAARSIAKQIGPLHQKIIAYLTEHRDGATDEAMFDALGMNPSTLRPRRIELVRAGRVKDSGRYALTKSLSKATVWCLT
jgi:hypothetical protein